MDFTVRSKSLCRPIVFPCVVSELSVAENMCLLSRKRV